MHLEKEFFVKKVLIIFLGLLILAAGLGFGFYNYVRGSLPNISSISAYKPLLVSTVFDRNNKKIGEFYHEKRILVSYDQIPEKLVQAFLAAEDDQFFHHQGVNYLAILRAAVANFRAGRTVQGGSTITQQVAKTFFLSSDKNILRKAKEALLALELENHLSKQEILYLYLNQIFFGQGAYGVATAAEVYYRKPVAKLTVPEMALLASLPKAPSAFSPVVNPVRAKERQIYVINRMADLKFITREDAAKFIKEPVRVYTRESYQDHAPYFVESVRQILTSQLSDAVVQDQGLKIYTSLDLDKQLAAQAAMEEGLKSVDRRQGFRGPLKNTVDPKEVGEFLLKTRNHLVSEAQPERIILADGQFVDYGPLDLNYSVRTKGLPFYLKLGKSYPAIVSKVDDEFGLVTLRLAEIEGVIDFETMQWARVPNAEKRFDLDQIKKPSAALKMGDVVHVKLTQERFFSNRLQKLIVQKKIKTETLPDLTRFVTFELDQEPLVQGSLLSFDLQTSEVIAMVGGYNYRDSKLNRTFQAKRQTGSSFKSIVYASAFDHNYTAATPIMDAPLVFEENKDTPDQEGQEENKVWKPSNHLKNFLGDIIFRNALVRSLNVPTVKIIEDLKVDWVADYARRLGIFSPLNMDFTLALGSSGVTLYEMTKVFSHFARLGKRIKPILIKKVLDKDGEKLLESVSFEERFKKDIEELEKTFDERRENYFAWKKQQLDLHPVGTEADGKPQLAQKSAPANPNQAEATKDIKKPFRTDENFFFDDQDQLIKPTTAYLITSLLKAVVEDKNGTGGRARALGRETAGKTGSSNGYYDAWFIGYTAQISTGVWVGFDQETTLGKGEVGGRAALPIWVDYMKAAHEQLPQMTIPIPAGIVFANIDADSGKLATSQSKSIIRQAFFEGTEPTSTVDKKEENTDFYKRDLSD